MSLWTDMLAAATRIVRDTFPWMVSYVPAATGVAVQITAIFDEAHQEVELRGEVPVSVTRPMVTMCLADLSAVPVPGDTLTVSGRGFEVSDVQPDGSGMCRLLLLET